MIVQARWRAGASAFRRSVDSLAALLILLLVHWIASSTYGNQAVADTPAQLSQPAAAGRSIGVVSVPNLRDLGGYRTSTGEVIKDGLVYRSSQLSSIGAADMEALDKLRLKVTYDLRTAEERKRHPDELPAGVYDVWLDVLADASRAGPAAVEKLLHDPKAANAALGGGKAEALFSRSYRDLISLPSARREFRKLFLGLGDRNQLPAIFHCTTGKDRTGWAAAALLTLLGVPRDAVYEDYLRSNDYILPAYQSAIDTFVAAGGDPGVPSAILGVRPEYLDAAFDEMKKQYGSIEGYFAQGLSIDEAQQQLIRNILLERL